MPGNSNSNDGQNSNSNSNDGENLIGASGTISQEDFDNLFSDDQSASDDQSHFFTPGQQRQGQQHESEMFQTSYESSYQPFQ